MLLDNQAFISWWGVGNSLHPREDDFRGGGFRGTPVMSANGNFSVEIV